MNKHAVDADNRDTESQSYYGDEMECAVNKNENRSEDIGHCSSKDSQPMKSVVHVTKIIPRPLDWHLTAKSAKLGVVQTFSMPTLINAMI
jgi:hypothetical protein